MARVIVLLSGGKASAWCAGWALKKYPRKDVILYFNDTKWEHSDLYRFLKDLGGYFKHPITIDADGRSVEQLFYDNNALANNMMPFCSRILKAERLQKYFGDGDTLVFGIGINERHRAERIIAQYQKISVKLHKTPTLCFPLIDNHITSQDIDQWLVDIKIKQPLLYTMGFPHNNCSGGCVRGGKNQWAHLLKKLPDVYAERERVEEEMRMRTGKDISYLKNETLKNLRLRIESGDTRYIRELNTPLIDAPECMGVCGASLEYDTPAEIKNQTKKEDIMSLEQELKRIADSLEKIASFVPATPPAAPPQETPDTPKPEPKPAAEEEKPKRRRRTKAEIEAEKAQDNAHPTPVSKPEPEPEPELKRTMKDLQILLQPHLSDETPRDQKTEVLNKMSAVLKKYGATTFPELKEEHYNAAYDEAVAVIESVAVKPQGLF